MSNLVDRFWSHVEIRGKDECWPWRGSNEDYAYFNNGEKTVSSHRFAYELENRNGSAKGIVVRHSYDNKPCCNPDHLLGGTQKDNMDDKMGRGRHRCPKGEECVQSKLKVEDVNEIRNLLKKGMIHRVIAEKFNVHTVTITDINLGRSWRHV